MYRDLRTNLPREIMGYSDFPFTAEFLGPGYSADPRQFCGHREVLSYLEAFADFHDLRPLVRRRTRVLGVEPAGWWAQVISGADGPSAPGAAAESGAGAAGAGSEEGELGWVVTTERVASGPLAGPSGRMGGFPGAFGAGSPFGPGALGQGMGPGLGLGPGLGPVEASLAAGMAAEGGEVQQELYDAVVVANGHYSEPRLPLEVKGMLGPDGEAADGGRASPFPGEQVHSHNYRSPERWRGKVVLVVGASNSGEDISRELSAGGAARVLLAARAWKNDAWGADPRPYGPGGNIYRMPMVTELHADGSATFEGGQREPHVDAVIYCTGFRYTFPFLKGAAATAAAVYDNCVGSPGPLWEHMLPVGPLGPGLSFLGLPWKVVPFPLAEAQARLVARLLSGRAALPPREAMEADVAAWGETMRQRGMPKRHSHMLGDDQFAYCDRLAALAGPDVPRLPPWREALYRAISKLKRSDPDNYKDGDLTAAVGDGGATAAAAAADLAAQAAALTGRPGGSLTGAGAGPASGPAGPAGYGKGVGFGAAAAVAMPAPRKGP
ncbi:hypothetical protein HYH03_015918 [Edaphochlamys debaryana]|uniref:Flavin-containing monooxygenase n=1 Tax=Edaphochlamys debaryana TaxID=47281 RepID=A0A836BQE7_9CHLO|nr:hypothetical protein HYH03_015918 [Edaphochlamys debaryana]|eukprot:KAG2485336.1 hypothetical protein HYH03_015918 [Edaphochlamys debaryana]